MYKRGAGNRSIVVCGGQTPTILASCEELPINASGLPAASSWRSFASLPHARASGCMLQVNGKVCVCLTAFFKCYPVLQLYYIGGIAFLSAKKDVYVYDEDSQQWQSAVSLPQALQGHRCVVLNCQGLVCGGFTANGVLSLRPF